MDIIKDTKEIKDENSLKPRKTLKTLKINEEIGDRKHSLCNTEKLNKIYTQLIHLFFGGKWFYLWAIFLFLCFVFSDEYFANSEYNILLVCHFLAPKILYSLNIVFIILISFPTAKGIRRFFRKLLDLMKKPQNKKE